LSYLNASTLNSVEYGGAASFEFAKPQAGTSVEAFNRETAQMDIQELAQMGRGLVEKIKEYADDVVCNCNLTRTVMDTHLVNTNNLDLVNRRSKLSVELQVQRVRGDDVFLTWTGHSAIGPDPEFEQVVTRVIERLRQAENLVSLDNLNQTVGKTTVILAPSSLGLLIIPLLLGLNGKNVALGVSPLANKLNEVAFDSRFSLLDNPHTPNRTGSTSFDDEGVPTKPNRFINQGLIQSFYYDLKSAGETHIPSSGHGQRQPENTRLGQPIASVHNLTVEAGTNSLTTMLEDVKEGLLVESVLGMGQTNIMAGTFSNSVGLAYKIKDGEIVGRVKDVSVAGNAYQLLKQHLNSISSERETVIGNWLLPYMRFDEVSVTAKN
jgi:PmbA protein